MGPKRKPAKKHDCVFCGKPCPSYAALEMHMNVHTLERPYMCAYCENSYPSASSLWVHENAVHLGRKYYCDICDREFRALANLIQHRKTHGTSALKKDRPKDNYVDEVDRSKFPSMGHAKIGRPRSASKTVLPERGSLLLSSTSSVPVRQFTCDICHKTFSAGFRLNAHKKLHGVNGEGVVQKMDNGRSKKQVILKWDASFFLHMNRYVPET